MVGREAELTQLQQLFAKAKRGERQLVFVTGEPGVGKTALVETFVAGLRGPGAGNGEQEEQRATLPDLWLSHGQCIEQFGAGEPYLPLLAALSQLGREPGHETLLTVLRQYAPTWLVQLPALVKPEERDSLLRQTAGMTRTRMLRELAEALAALTAAQPLVLVLEDLHWSDPSTIEMLAFLTRRTQPARLLVIGTYRPAEMLSDGHPLKAVTQELYGHGLATEVTLEGLSEAAIAAYLEQRCPGGTVRAPLRQGVVQALHRRTEGNPLFMVSLVNDLLARDVLIPTDAGWELQDEAAAIDSTVPDTIRHLVARQSGRLSPDAQHTLEAASVAGTEFSAAAVAAALRTDTAVIEHRCELLAESHHFLKRVGIEAWPDGTLAARYGFLHALYQQLWHERVTPTRLQQFHRAIGERKERAYGERVREIAAEMAVHFEQGRDYGKAVQYHGQAGQQALQRSAPQEAIAHLTTGVALLEYLPATRERDQLEIGLQMALGLAWMMTKGYAAPEAAAAYARAHALCQRPEDMPQLFPSLFGLFLFYSMRGQLKTAQQVETRLQSLVQRHQDPIALIQAHHASATLSLFQGDFATAHTSWRRCLAMYEPQQALAHLSLYDSDPGVVASVLSAFVSWVRGYPEQAVRQAEAALTQAQALANAQTHIFTLFWRAALSQERREVTAVQRYTASLLSLAREHGIANGLAHGMIMHGWALAEQGQVEEGIAQIREGLAMVRTIGIGTGQAHSLILLAEAYSKRGQIKEGLSVLTEALAQVEKTGDRSYEAELYRLKGELTLQQHRGQATGNGQQKNSTDPRPLSPDSQGEAETCFLKAIHIARRQQAKMWELRAAVSLARLWRGQGKAQQAQKMLAEIYHWFTEGFDTKDLQEAKALLEELA